MKLQSLHPIREARIASARGASRCTHSQGTKARRHIQSQRKLWIPLLKVFTEMTTVIGLYLRRRSPPRTMRHDHDVDDIGLVNSR